MKSVNILMPQAEAQHHGSYLKHYCETDKETIVGQTRELVARRKNGREFPISLTVSKIHSQGRDIFTSVLRDISAEKRLLQEYEEALGAAQASARMKSEFLASMSHEIRTPMNGVLGMLGLLSRTELTPQQRHYADLSKSSGETLLVLINDILDFSKIEAGKLELEIIDFDLQAQLQEIVAFSQLRAEEKGLQIVLDTDGVESPMVKGDPGRIRQILTNLVSNAIKFTEQGSITIRAKLIPEEGERLSFECSVIDTGIGIPADKASRLFESFTQVDASTTRKYGGTGLGLAIVKQLCDLMGGVIGVDSKPGEGSNFSFRLELQVSHYCLQQCPELDLKAVPILVVDDNATNREVLSEQLTSRGARVTAVQDGESALQLLSKPSTVTFAAAILDLQMSDLDGAALGKKIRQNRRWDSMPMMMLSSVDERGGAQYFADLGFAAYFSKPVSSTDLFDALAVMLEGGESLQAAQPLITHHNLHSLGREPSCQGARILLVEDNRINQEVARGILEDFGCLVDVAANGLEAIHALAVASLDAPFQMVLMDCQMPELDGYEATRRIRSGVGGVLNPQVPIVAMTANAMKGDKENCLAAGMNDYLSKPIDEEKLLKMLQQWLQPVPTLVTETETETDSLVAQLSEEKTVTMEVDELQVWDKDAVLKRVKGKSERLQMLIRLFVEDIPARMDELQQSVAAGDWSRACSAAHGVKGVAANMSGLQLQSTLAKMEAAAKQGSGAEVIELMPLASRQSQRLIDALKAALNETA